MTVPENADFMLKSHYALLAVDLLTSIVDIALLYPNMRRLRRIAPNYTLSGSYQANENALVTTRLMLPLDVSNSILYLTFLILSAYFRAVALAYPLAHIITIFEWFWQATYVQLRNNTPIEIYVKTANKLSFNTRDYSGNTGRLVVSVSECAIDEVLTMAPVKHEVSWKCYSKWEANMHMKVPTHHFTYESDTARSANATVDYKVVLNAHIGRASVAKNKGCDAIVSFLDTISVEKFDEEALSNDAIAAYCKPHDIH